MMHSDILYIIMPGQEYSRGQDKKELKIVIGLTIFLTTVCCLITEGVPSAQNALDALSNLGTNHSTNWNHPPNSNSDLGTPNTHSSPNNSGSRGAEPSDGGAWNDACDNTLQELLNPDCSSWPPK